MRALVVGNADRRTDKISAAQLDPFFRNRQRLRRELGLTFTHVPAVAIAEIEQICLAAGADYEILFIRPGWRDEAGDVVSALKAIHAANPRRQIFFIDPWDQVTSRFFGVLPYVTKLLKYQRLKDVSLYQKDFIGGTVITDYLARERDIGPNGFHVGSPVPDGYENRIVTGWNVSVSRRFEALLLRPWWWRLRHREFRRRPKDIDIFCHMSYSSIHDWSSWYTRYRMSAVEAAKRELSKHRLAVTGEFPENRTVSTNRYRDELERSRIVFSPFGWGETTWRDYEAVCGDCLLLKPNVDHIDTAPNIYLPDETYVPLKWDFSDLQEKCDFYLAHPDESARIVRNARRAFEAYFRAGEFVDTIAGLLKQNRFPAAAADPVFFEDPDASSAVA